jgi:hypothetical protein
MNLPSPTGAIKFYQEFGTANFRVIHIRWYVSPAIPGCWQAGLAIEDIARRSCWRWMGGA